jgi:hypothetical protein
MVAAGRFSMSSARLRFFLTVGGGGRQGFLGEGIENKLQLVRIELLRGAPEELARQGVDLEPQHFFLLLEALVFLPELPVLLG